MSVLGGLHDQHSIAPEYQNFDLFSTSMMGLSSHL